MFRAEIVRLIVDGRAEHAISVLSKYYEVGEPQLRVGTVKRHRKVAACYVEKEKRIYVSKSELLTEPFVILHEFYHHLRASQLPRNTQIKSRADLFALSFIEEFKRLDPRLKPT